jgi:hypothetical protein
MRAKVFASIDTPPTNHCSQRLCRETTLILETVFVGNEESPVNSYRRQMLNYH